MSSKDFADRSAQERRWSGYWVVLDAPVATERIARIGYDYVALDGQRGLLGYQGLLTGLLAVDAGVPSATERSAWSVSRRSTRPRSAAPWTRAPRASSSHPSTVRETPREQAGISAGIHTPDGQTAHRRLAQGYTFATVASDLTHLETIAAAHLETARTR